MKTNDEIRRENLAIAIKRFGSQRELAEKAGCSAQYLSQVKTNTSRSGRGRPTLMGDDLARRIEIAIGEPPGWMDAPHDIQIAGYGLSTLATIDDQDDVEIPQYDAGGGMGSGKLLLDGQPGIIKNWHVDHEWIRQNVRNHTGINNLCIVTGFGPSMRPMFNPGDPLLVDRGVTTAELDAIYFFRIGKHGFIKTLQRIPKGNDVILRAKSKNPDYDSFDIDASMDFQVLGRVLTIWKSEQF